MNLVVDEAEDEVVGEVRAEGLGEDEVMVEVLQVALDLEDQVTPALVVVEDALDWIRLKFYGNELSSQPLVSITVKLLALLYHLHQIILHPVFFAIYFLMMSGICSSQK